MELQQHKLHGLSVRAQARRTRISLSFSVAEVFLVPVSPAQRDEARRVEVQYRVSVRGALSLVLIAQATAEEIHRVIANRDL